MSFLGKKVTYSREGYILGGYAPPLTPQVLSCTDKKVPKEAPDLRLSSHQM